MTSNNNGKHNSRGMIMVPLRYVLISLGLIILAIFIFAGIFLSAPMPEIKPMENKAPLVEVENIQRQDISFNITSQGVVKPRTSTQLLSEVSGKIIAMNSKFNVGGFFRKGELLATIDDVNYQVNLTQAQARLQSAEAKLTEEKARQEQAKQQWLLTGKKLSQAPALALRTPQLQQAKADLKSAQANLKAAKINVERTKIKAPYDAMVKQKNVDIGQFVSMGSPIATTFAVDYAEVRLPVKQQDIEFLNLPKIDQTASIASPVEITYSVNGKSYQWQTTITRYEGEVDSKSRVHYVVAQIDDPYGILNNAQMNAAPELRIGTFVKANIVGKTVDNIVKIPRSALRNAKNLYFIDQENKLHIQEITILRGDKDHVYSQDQFDQQFRLITTQLQTPVEGMLLRVVGETPPPNLSEQTEVVVFDELAPEQDKD